MSSSDKKDTNIKVNTLGTIGDFVIEIGTNGKLAECSRSKGKAHSLSDFSSDEAELKHREKFEKNFKLPCKNCSKLGCHEHDADSQNSPLVLMVESAMAYKPKKYHDDHMVTRLLVNLSELTKEKPTVALKHENIVFTRSENVKRVVTPKPEKTDNLRLSFKKDYENKLNLPFFKKIQKCLDDGQDSGSVCTRILYPNRNRRSLLRNN